MQITTQIELPGSKGSQNSSRRWNTRDLCVQVAVIVWAALIGLGLVSLLVYHNSPGRRSDHFLFWQENRLVSLDTTRDNLLVFIHPQCPCSKATLAELARIQADCGNRLCTNVAIYQPDAEGWSNTSIVRQALDIPLVHVFADPNGELATLFGAETSGHVMLFSPDGQRIFSGGITPGRSHEGDSLGREAILGYVNHRELSCGTSHVYGCPIVDRTPDRSTVSK